MIFGNLTRFLHCQTSPLKHQLFSENEPTFNFKIVCFYDAKELPEQNLDCELVVINDSYKEDDSKL